MDMLWSLGEFFLQMVGVAVALLYLAQSVTSINETQSYIEKQTYSDGYRNRYASLSSFNSDAVGKISVQEALNLVYTQADDSSPVVIKGPDGVIHVFVKSKSGWRFSTNGKAFGAKYDIQGNLLTTTLNSNIGALDLPTEPLPTYQDLYNYVSNNQSGDIFYICNIDPDNTGSLRTVLLVATN